MPKLIDSLHYHLWTDALHLRALARQTSSDWDRGTCVRASVNAAWTVFEAACEDALHLSAHSKIFDFKRRVDETLKKRGLAPVDWSRRPWQDVRRIYDLRKDYVHIRDGVDRDRLITKISESDDAITILRGAIKAIYSIAGCDAPGWVADDEDPGMQVRGGKLKDAGIMTGKPNCFVIGEGVAHDDPEAIRVGIVLHGEEMIRVVEAPGADYVTLMERVVAGLNPCDPISAVRAYRGKELIEERKFDIRESLYRP